MLLCKRHEIGEIAVVIKKKYGIAEHTLTHICIFKALVVYALLKTFITIVIMNVYNNEETNESIYLYYDLQLEFIRKLLNTEAIFRVLTNNAII